MKDCKNCKAVNCMERMEPNPIAHKRYVLYTILGPKQKLYLLNEDEMTFTQKKERAYVFTDINIVKEAQARLMHITGNDFQIEETQF